MQCIAEHSLSDSCQQLFNDTFSYAFRGSKYKICNKMSDVNIKMMNKTTKTKNDYYLNGL